MAEDITLDESKWWIMIDQGWFVRVADTHPGINQRIYSWSIVYAYHANI